MERKRDKQMEKLFEGNVSHWTCWGEGSGKRSRPDVSLCGLTQAPLWAPWSSFLSGRKAHFSGPPLPLQAAVSELLPFKVRHDSAVLGPRAARPLRLLQALLGQLGQVLLWWKEGQSGEGERQW